MIFGWIDIEWDQVMEVLEIIALVFLGVAFIWTILIPIFCFERLKEKFEGSDLM